MRLMVATDFGPSLQRFVSHIHIRWVWNVGYIRNEYKDKVRIKFPLSCQIQGETR